MARARIAAADGIRAVGELLAEAGDDQQRVVDAEREAHHRADDEGDRVDRHERAEQDEDAAAGEDGEGAEEERDRGGDQRAEDDQQDDEEQRDGEQLGALGGVIVSSCRPRETEAKPDCVAVSGGWMRSSRVRSRAGTVSRIAVASGTW